MFALVEIMIHKKQTIIFCVIMGLAIYFVSEKAQQKVNTLALD